MKLSPGRFGGPALAVVIDRVFGEPPLRPHPVAALGSALARMERAWWADDRTRGAVHAVAGIGLGALSGAVLRSTVLVTSVAVAGRGLDEAADDVARALDAGDLDAARDLLPSLVGRDPTGLSAEEIARAAVESVAENTVDAVVAPVLWAVVAGAAGAGAYRAANTLDAMVGHRSERYERFGWASARIDDAANLVPARVAAVLVAVVRPRSAVAVATTVRRCAPAHPSPSGGVIESAFAAALGVTLGGPSRYSDRVEDRPRLGDGRPVRASDVAAARRLARDVDLALAGVLAVVEGTVRIRRRFGRGGPSGAGSVP